MFKRKVVCAITLLFLVLGNLVCYPSKVFAYSTTPTHPNLTKEMIRLYNLYYDPDITGEAYNRIVQGSIDEDMAPRWSFHLYDPVYNRAPFGVATAKQWAIEDIQGDAIHKFANALFNIFGSTKFSYHGDFSWNKNIKNFVGNKTNEAWYGLGHVLHLIADMTVPAHSRNDHHIQGDPFESWTGANLKASDYNFADKIYNNNPYGPFDVTFISEAFDDLARYSNKYFFSKDSVLGTHLGNQYNNPKIIDTKEYDYGKYLTRFYAMGRDDNNELIILAQINTLKRKWLDATPGNKTKNDNVYMIDDKDYNIHLDYWQRLAPKAVEYGMAVIRLFVENANYEKQKLVQQQNPLNVAQVTSPGSSNSTNNFNNVDLIGRLPKIQPVRLPEIQSVIVEPVNPPVEAEVPPNLPEDNHQEENKGKNQEENKGDNKEKDKENQNQPTIVTGPVTGGDGGVNPRSIKQEEPPPQENQNNNPPDPNPEPKTDPEPKSEPHLVINEIQIRDNEFVELYNPTSSVIDLSDYYFSYYAQNNDWNDPHRNQEFPASASINVGGYYLIGLKGYSEIEGNPKADWQPYNSNQLSNTHGSVAIFSFNPKDDTKTVEEVKSGAIDVVAWDDVNFVKEGTEFQQTLGVDKSMQRNKFKDTDDNNVDFEHQTIPSPTNSQSQTKTQGTSIPDNLIINEDTTWTIANSPYYIMSNSNQWPIVEEGFTLTIEPGVVVMSENPYYTILEIRGTLKAEGTADDNVVFTSIKDGDYGGDGTAMPGDWLNVIFTSTSQNSILENVIFRYGGHRTGWNNVESEMVKIDGSQVTIEGVVMEKSLTRGLHLINSNSVVRNSTFRDSKVGVLIEGASDTSTIDNSLFDNNSEFGLQIVDEATPTISNNKFLNNGKVGVDSYYNSQGAIVLRSSCPDFVGNQVADNLLNGVLLHDTFFFAKDCMLSSNLPYIFFPSSGRRVIVDEGITLTLSPDTIIKTIGEFYTLLEIRGTLKAEATIGNEIVFTSINDDSFGGDTNNNGNDTAPASGDWKNIKFETTSVGSVFDNVFMYYGIGEPPFELVGSASVEIKTVDYTP